ncbi:DUF1593 domain-containing protein [Gaoshiqia sediminis]|uniref:DUF1593 domain-containing protein n=1 Tax=Gaoshiqia sediminis TaxID=2986998 RepID=A0AA42C8Y3_9BACT|nr:DUF1593 domain-containing protein [Gaoshiqia sediminis]MCW0481787.1 DUF1593 domain-containing protein [Gaoshiqia sediminis]
MQKSSSFFFVLISLVVISCGLKATKEGTTTNRGTEKPYRVIVSTDIGGTDPDDFQSMVHLLLYADTIDLEGLISSPFGPGRKEHILQVIDAYEKDYPNLKQWSNRYPAPDALRKITKQGGVESAPYQGFSERTEGSDWIIECARRDDPRPLFVLIWGGIEDLAQALHDAPDILPKLRVYYIGGPNKKWGPDAFQYLADNFPGLWIIESNATYRGWFTGGNQSDEWSNTAFPAKYIDGRGAMADFFMTQLGGTIKMGDTPSLAWLLNSSDPEDPTIPNWGGQYTRAWERPYRIFNRMPESNDTIAEFTVMELALPLPNQLPSGPEACLKVENQALPGTISNDGTMRFRFSPKGAKVFRFEIESNVPELNGQTGQVTAVTTPPWLASQPSEKFPNWYTDDPRMEWREGPHIGAKTVSQWREDYLRDFARRMRRCQPASK